MPLRPFRQHLPKLDQPAQLGPHSLHRHVERRRLQPAWIVHQRERLPTPFHQFMQVHEASLRPLTGRYQERQFGLLDRRLRQSGVAGETLPPLVLLQPSLEQARCHVLAVVDLVCLGMAIDKHLHPPVEVSPVVIHNRAGNARSQHGILQAYVHGLLGRVGHRLQGNQLHVPMAQRLAHGKLAQPSAKNDQTLALADLDRMVDHPDPVLGHDLGAEQGRQADSQEPQSAGRPIGGGFVDRADGP